MLGALAQLDAYQGRGPRLWASERKRCERCVQTTEAGNDDVPSTCSAVLRVRVYGHDEIAFETNDGLIWISARIAQHTSCADLIVSSAMGVTVNPQRDARLVNKLIEIRCIG